MPRRKPQVAHRLILLRRLMLRTHRLLLPPQLQRQEEVQKPIKEGRCSLRTRKPKQDLFAAYAVFRDAFDTEPDPTLSALATAATQPNNHPVSMYLPEPTTFHAVLRQPPEMPTAPLSRAAHVPRRWRTIRAEDPISVTTLRMSF